VEPLRAAEEFVSSARDEGRRWLDTSEVDLYSTLRWLDLPESHLDEVMARYGDLRRDPVFGPLVGGMVQRLMNDRGELDQPLPIWPDFDEFGDLGRLWWIYVVGLATPSLVTFHESRGLPADVTRRTVSVLARHANLHERKWGTPGVDAGWWMIPVIRGELVQVGSLQFHRYHLGVSVLTPRPWFTREEATTLGPGFRDGDEAWGVHIPDGTDLSESALEETWERARDVLHLAWPPSTRRLATLQSWMMDSRLAEFLGPDSRIVRFQREFHAEARWGHDVDNVVEFVFRQPASHLPGLVARTRVQAAVLEVLRSGDSWRDGVGWRDFDRPDLR
jgi:hypothetical protein